MQTQISFQFIQVTWRQFPRRFIAAMLFVLLGLGVTFSANADCKRGRVGYDRISFVVPNQIVIPRDAPPGTVFLTVTGTPLSGGNFSYDYGAVCTENLTLTEQRTAASQYNGYYDWSIFATTIPGAGFALRIKNLSAGTYWKIEGPTTETTGACQAGAPAVYCRNRILANAQLEFIKTSSFITRTAFSSSIITSLSLQSSDMTSALQYATFAFSNNFNVVPQTCQIAAPSISVPLTSGNGLNATSFTGIGSTSTPVAFSLGVNCSGVSAKAAITFTDARNSGNTSNTLPLTATSIATGLGVQILRNNIPINFGPDSSVAGNTNQIQLFTASGTTGLTSLPFTARYIQTAEKITAGTANSLATFTMSYQ